MQDQLDFENNIAMHEYYVIPFLSWSTQSTTCICLNVKTKTTQGLTTKERKSKGLFSTLNVVEFLLLKRRKSGRYVCGGQVNRSICLQGFLRTAVKILVSCLNYEHFNCTGPSKCQRIQILLQVPAIRYNYPQVSFL